jgi:hypothetical protein
MNTGPAKYAGVAAAFVFGVGLLIVGKISLGISVLGMAVYVLAMVMTFDDSTKALLTAIMAIIWAVVLGYQAISSEITGKTTYHHWRVRGNWSEPVTREESPKKFRKATNALWWLCVLSTGVSVCAAVFYRKADDPEDSF